jgi:RNA polymerase sigma-70 factor (ECF subfamily)
MWRQHDRLEITGSVQAYLWRAVRNSSVNRLRRQHVEHRWHEAEAARSLRLVASVEEQASEEDLARAIAHAVDELPERCRLIFTLNRYQGLTYDQIAASLDLSRKTVETQMGRAIRALRKKLRDHLPP